MQVTCDDVRKYLKWKMLIVKCERERERAGSQDLELQSCVEMEVEREQS